MVWLKTVAQHGLVERVDGEPVHPTMLFDAIARHTHRTSGLQELIG